MDSQKREEIRSMLKFLEYNDKEDLLMQEITLEDKTWPSCNNKGQFFSNRFLSKRPLLVPPDNVVNYAHHMLSRECRLKLTSLTVKRGNFPFLGHLLKKYYKLNFLPTC